MTTPIGYATLQIIPSLDGVSDAVTRQLGNLKGVGKSAGRDFGKSFVGGAETDLNRLGDSYAKQYDRMKDATGKLRAEEAKLQDLRDKGVTGGRLEAQSQRAEKARRDEARTVRETAGAYRDLEDAQKRAASAGESSGGGGGFLDKLKGFAGQAKSSGGEAASGFVEGFGGPISELGTKGGPIGIALAGAAVVALGAGALIAKNVLAGMDQLQDQANVAAKLGLSPAQMKPVADAAAKAYAGNFGESIAGNMDAAGAAIQSGLLGKDASAKDIQGIVERLTTVSGLLGEEIPATARAAQQAIRTGLAPDAESAFDLIVKGQQAGINTSDDFLDTLNEYGTQFRKLGLSGPEAVGLISQAMKGGARDSDVAADALKEFSIRAIDGSKTTVDGFESLGLSADKMREKIAAGGPVAHDALGQVLDSLRNIKDPAEQSRVAVELFGTQAEDLGGALKNFDLTNAVGQLGEVAGAAQRASDTVGGTAASSVESAKRSIEVSVDSIQQTLATSAGPAIKDFAQMIVDHKGDIINFFSTIGTAAITGAQAIIPALASIAGGFGDIIAPIGDALGALYKFNAWQADVSGDHAKADSLREQSEQFFSWGDGLKKFADGAQTAVDKLDPLKQKLGDVGTNALAAQENAQRLATILSNLPGGKTIDINAIVNYTDTQGRVIPADQLRTPARQAATPGGTAPTVGGGRAGGGMLPGYSETDNMLVPMAGGEGVIKARVMRKLGPAWLAAINNGYADGGVVGLPPDVAAAQALAGTKYSQGNRTDCSGMPARVIARALGLPESGLMTTKNASQWLAAAGFKPGTGGPGQISVGWYDHGPNPNDGHMAMTLSDGTHAEAGGKNGVFTLGAEAAGADSPQFDQHMFLPTLFGEGQAGSFGGYSSSGGGAGTPGIGPNGESGTYSAPDAKAAREADERIADADQRVKEAEAKQRELKADAKESEKISAQAAVDKATREAADARADRDEVMKGKFTADKAKSGSSSGGSSSLSLPSTFSGFGSAIGEFAGGQIASALDVFGVGDSPPWLQAASKLIGGISVGPGDSSAGPLAAAPAGTGTPPPADDGGNVHGLRAGQAPGPGGVTYNIRTATVEDAFLQAQRKQNERAAAKVAVF